MLPKGTISKLQEYFFTASEWRADIERAVAEFFGEHVVREKRLELHDEQEEGLFSEWFVYDFRLSSGRTPLGEFVENNPIFLTPESLNVYRGLLENEYGAWEANDVRREEGMTITNLLTGHTYDVHERSGTRSLSNGNLFFARVGRANNRWELLGSNSFGWNIKVDQGLRDAIRKTTGGLNPKMVRDIYYSPTGPEKKQEEEVSLPEAEQRFEVVLIETGLNKHISLSTAQRWIRSAKPEEIPWFMAILFGLFYRTETSEERIKEVLSAFQDLNNATPYAKLSKHSSNELRKRSSGTKRDIHMNSVEIGGWMEPQARAFDLIKHGRALESCEAWNDCFHLFYEERTTCPDIWRMFANAAVAYLADGDEKTGLRLVDMALSLNPNYDFALDLKERHENGDDMSGLMYGRMRRLSEGRNLRRVSETKFRTTYFYRYFNWINRLGINFSTSEITDTPRTLFARDGSEVKIGRNDPCPCGKKKEDGMPMKYKKCCGKK